MLPHKNLGAPWRLCLGSVESVSYSVSLDEPVDEHENKPFHKVSLAHISGFVKEIILTYRNGFCKYGHDTAVSGRHKGGHCALCVKVNVQKKDPTYLALSKRKSRYKLEGFKNPDGTPFTLVAYDRLYQIQTGRCGICKTHQSELTKGLAVDHDHKTSIVRGLLCFDCNTSLGKLGDSIDAIEQVLIYLRGVPPLH